MRRSRLLTALFAPSLTSGTLCILLAGGLLGVFNWAALLKRVFFYDYFFGAQGLVTTLQGEGAGAVIHRTIISAAVVDDIIIFFVAAAVGALLLTTLESLHNAQHKAQDVYAAVRSADSQLRLEFVRRLLARACVVVAWGAYMIVSVRLILPFCVLAAKVGLHLLWSWQGLAYLAFGFVLLAVALHVQVIFLRLSLLRARVFHGQEIAEEL